MQLHRVSVVGIATGGKGKVCVVNWQAILLKLEKYLCKVIHLFTHCFVARQQLCTNLLLSPPKKNDI